MNLRLSLLFLAAGLFAKAQSPLARVPGGPFDAGAGPYGAVTADFNNDGVPDLAFAAYGTSSITVLLGNGKGGFTPAPGSPYRAGAETLTVVTGDFNGDGILDLAGLSTLAGPMYLGQGFNIVLFGNGQGGFSSSGDLGFSIKPSQLTRGFPINFASADLNGDGKTDLVMQNTNGVWALLSDGTGGFDIAPGSPFTADYSGIAVADFNRDGRLDVAVSSSDRHSVTVYLGDGNGRFRAGPETVLPASYHLGTTTVADWNADHIPDLAVGAGDAGVAVLLGDGNGGFQLRSTLSATPKFGRQPFSVSDVNGDGFPDLFVSDGTSAVLFAGDGNGMFSQIQSFALGDYLGFLVAADYNLDGKTDIVSSTGIVFVNSLQTIPVSTVALEFHSAAGSSPPHPIQINIGPVAGLNINTDQSWARLVNSQVVVESASLSPGHHQANIRLTAPGYYGAAIRVNLDVVAPSGVLTFHSSEPEPLLPLGDFNNDGKPDLLRLDNGALTIRLNDGSGNFQGSGLRSPLTLGVGASALGDFNGDGNLDVAVLGQNGISLYPGDGIAGLQAGHPTSIKSDVGAFQSIVADFNGDGYLDIATASASHMPVQMFLGDGHGGFREVQNPAPGLPANPAQIVVGDFNNDGVPDLAISEYGIGNVYLLLGDGRGRFQISQVLSFGSNGFTSIAAGDWNSDGNLDLAVRNWRGETDTFLTIFSGNGKGQLTQINELRYAKPRLVGAVTAADVDGDGNLDLLIGLDDQTVVLLLGDGKGGFFPSEGGPVGKGYNALTTDLNGDGRTDVIIRGLDQFSIWLGGPAPSTVTLTQGAPNPFTFGQTVSFAAKITAGPGAFRPPTGTVSLIDGSTVVGNAPVVQGSASFSVPYRPGTHYFRAAYNGDARFGQSETSLAVIETGAPALIQTVDSNQPFRALVTDANNNPVSGVGVIFTAPQLGPSGSFSTRNSTIAITNQNGIATAGLFTLNDYPGPFAITVTVSGYPNLSAIIQLRN